MFRLPMSSLQGLQLLKANDHSQQVILMDKLGNPAQVVNRDNSASKQILRKAVCRVAGYDDPESMARRRT